MLAKKQKAKLTHFSSEDSQNTDHSMNSSLEISESNAQNNHANKFNQLRETMNQLFLANPELAEEIKFERYLETGEPEGDSPRNMPASPLKKTAPGSNDHLAGGNEEAGGNISSAKFWGAISKEMTKPQKNSKMPSINQINHILNIYKAKFEKPEQMEMSLSPTKSVLKKPKSEFRIQSAKVGGDKQLLSSRLKDGKQGAQNNSNQQEEGEDGVNYYSFRKKMHLKLKQKRIEQELEEQSRKREEAERERLAKEREQKQLQTLTYPDVGDEIKKAASIMKLPSMKLDIENQAGEASTRHGTRIIKPRGSGSRRNSVKGKGDIFERLTKDFTNKNAATEEDDENHPKRTFTSPFAESLYNDMKAFGDPEAFKKIAQARINNYKKEFKEKLSKQKQLPLEGLRFSKDKSRYLNMYVPDFEKAAAFPNKDLIFNVKEIQKDSEEWKENADYETLAKFQKIRSGNILEFWQESKDLNQ